MNEAAPPLVSIGMPIRNGGAVLESTIAELLRQTHADFEIIVSDNDSSDQTGKIGRSFAAKDSRVQYFRQEKTISAIDNFRFVCERAKGKYFMWAAHDDRRDPDFIETLVAALEADRHAVLAFTPAVDFEAYDYSDAKPLLYPFETDQATPVPVKLDRLQRRSTHAYGLYRRAVFEGWYWQAIDFGWDQVLLAFVGARGTFLKTGKSCFYCYRPVDRTEKTLAARAVSVSYRKLKPFPYLRRAWAMSKAESHGERLEGRFRPALLNFALLYPGLIWWPWVKQEVRKISPHWFINLYLTHVKKPRTAEQRS